MRSVSDAGRKVGRRPGLNSGSPAVGRMVSLREDEWGALDDEAKKRGITRSELLRRCISEFFENHN